LFFKDNIKKIATDWDKILANHKAPESGIQKSEGRKEGRKDLFDS